jgi:hypothetical protein
MRDRAGATIRLSGGMSREAAIKVIGSAPNGWLVKIGPPPRTLKQSDRFWATCGAVAKTDVTWSGSQQDKQGWHDLFLSGWHTVKGRMPRLLIGLEGERVSLGLYTRDLGEAEMSELLDYTDAWCAMRGISTGVD